MTDIQKKNYAYDSSLIPVYFDEVIMGNVLTAGCGQNPPRQAAIYAGLPEETNVITVQKVCASGMKAIALAAQAICAGDADIIVAGGMENMSNVPYAVADARWGYRMNMPFGKITDLMVHDGLWEIFNAYHEVASIRDKDEFLIPFIEAIMDPAFHTGTPEADQTLLKSLIVFACLMEGLFFYVGFTQILALGRQNKMVGAAEQYQYILRDESMHCNFGIDLINQLKLENPHLWTNEFKADITALFHQAVELEYRYAEDTMPRGVLGLNASMFKGYLRYIANRRATQIGLDALFPNEENPFPWMSEMIDLKKERNFFETRVIEYQTGGALSWD